MNTNQNLMRLGPRIKLLRRQMQEWQALLIHQRQIRFLTKEHDEQKDKRFVKHRIVILQQITDQALRLSQVMERQSEERHQLKARHQQEEIDLEHAINRYKLS